MLVQLKLETYALNGNQVPTRCRYAHRNIWRSTLLTINIATQPYGMEGPILHTEALLKLLKASPFYLRDNTLVLLKPCLALASQLHHTSLELTTALKTPQTLVAGVNAYSN